MQIEKNQARNFGQFRSFGGIKFVNKLFIKLLNFICISNKIEMIKCMIVIMFLIVVMFFEEGGILYRKFQGNDDQLKQFCKSSASSRINWMRDYRC